MRRAQASLEYRRQRRRDRFNARLSEKLMLDPKDESALRHREQLESAAERRASGEKKAIRRIKRYKRYTSISGETGSFSP